MGLTFYNFYRVSIDLERIRSERSFYHDPGGDLRVGRGLGSLEVRRSRLGLLLYRTIVHHQETRLVTVCIFYDVETKPKIQDTNVPSTTKDYIWKGQETHTWRRRCRGRLSTLEEIKKGRTLRRRDTRLEGEYGNNKSRM